MYLFFLLKGRITREGHLTYLILNKTNFKIKYLHQKDELCVCAAEYKRCVLPYEDNNRAPVSIVYFPHQNQLEANEINISVLRNGTNMDLCHY